jgi:hypothetical protein
MPLRPRYKGSRKHKDWRPGGGFGTICPNWTHTTEAGGFAGDPEAHAWPQTAAQQLLANSTVDDRGARYAAARGIAFRAYPSGDGTWHGYPVPWAEVPPNIQDRLVHARQVERRELRRQKPVRKGDLRWALKSDEE